MFEITINSREIGFLWISHRQKIPCKSGNRQYVYDQSTNTFQDLRNKGLNHKGSKAHLFPKAGTMFEEGKIHLS